MIYGRRVFPLNELYIVIALLVLIAGGLTFLLGEWLRAWVHAWESVLLWGMGVLFLLLLVGAPILLFLEGREKISERRWPSAAAHLLGSLLLGLAWLAAVGYCVYRGYLAIP